MPELPEVEAVVRALRPFVRGRKITRVRVLHPIAVRPSSGKGADREAARLERELPGRRIKALKRRMFPFYFAPRCWRRMGERCCSCTATSFAAR